MRFWVLCLLGFGLLLPLGAGATVPVPDGYPKTSAVTYDVWREGSRIGTYQVDFQRDGDRLRVHTRMNVEVSLLFIPFYHFDHEAVEDWVDGKLVHYASKTDDNGTDRNVLLARDGNTLRGQYNSQQVTLPADIIPCSLWNPATVDQKQLLDPTAGEAFAVTVFDRGLEPVKEGAQTVEARHYSITGEMNREVWYGADGLVIQASYKAADESLLTFKLRSVDAGSPAASQTALK
ncbi:hypothetical protein FRZ44_04480 [Hypericibacter terrae]|jgi:hypothetical protein|uniref:DUF3108 domain-containing protein n=1 Tax=Hypericibacter terrae TaxID=2602015 RepID=A0A5J6MCS2_9PROT|nr:DUF6134 family protein [Hypericibacter terrae]QEX15168.1 hypothetical protein FRZ44_04480 [Hypericibacter terrae]